MTQKQMTPEKVITQVIRERIFALYWGQYVVSFDGCKHLPTKANPMTATGDYFLLLKPLSSITDEDAVEVAKIMNGMDEAYGITAENIKEETSHAADITPCADFLRSKRYALSYMDWTVEELIESRVYKLQNS